MKDEVKVTSNSISCPVISVAQGSMHGLAGCLCFKVPPGAAIKGQARTADISGID